MAPDQLDPIAQIERTLEHQLALARELAAHGEALVAGDLDATRREVRRQLESTRAMYYACHDGALSFEDAIPGILEYYATLTRELDALAAAPGLQARIAELEAVLREVEWKGGDSDFAYCPWCDAREDEPGHAPGCRLAAVLAPTSGRREG